MSNRSKILGIKYRHFIPLASFESAVADVHRFGSAAHSRITRYKGIGLAVCDLGNLEIVGCREDLPKEMLGASIVLEVQGLRELAAELCAHGALILHGPESTERGLTMSIRHVSGELVEYLEPTA